MEKFKDLLKKLGASETLTKSIVEELAHFQTETEKRYSDEYRARITRAKKVCVEEISRYKRDLSRRVSVFLETKQTQIAKAIEKQQVTEGALAADKLSRVRAVVEGITLPAASTAEEVKKLSERVDVLEGTNKKLAEERDAAVRRATKATDIANKVLSDNRSLEQKLAEATEHAPKEPVTEGKQNQVVTEGTAPKRSRLEDLRKKPAPSVSTVAKSGSVVPKSEIDEIAASIKE